MRDREARAASETERDREAAVSPWRCDRERQRARRERESAKLEPRFERDPRRHARQDPLAAATAGCHCPICPAQLRAFIESQFTGIYSLTLIFSFKFQNLVSCDLRFWESKKLCLWCLSVSCLCFYWWTELIWSFGHLVLVLRLNWTKLFVFFFFLAFWLCDFVFVSCDSCII